jgi:tetratricopeptide (TPR) repeat protein
VNYRTSTPVAACFLIATTLIAAAEEPTKHDLRIELYGHAEVALFGYYVTLQDVGRHTESHHASVESGDSFTFRAVPPGDYMASVYNTTGQIVMQEMVRVGGGYSILRLQMRTPPAPRPAADRVSVRQLQSPPSRKAVQAFVAALKYSEAGQPEKAAVELEKAIRISPVFAEAHTNLAAMCLRTRRYEQAIVESTRAMEIGAPNALDLGNRALAEWALGRYDDAIQSAAKALRLSPDAPTPHFVLGSLLIDNPATLREGIRHLERVAARLPDAMQNLERARAALAAR